jgi:hypothetical protein
MGVNGRCEITLFGREAVDALTRRSGERRLDASSSMTTPSQSVLAAPFVCDCDLPRRMIAPN